MDAPKKRKPPQFQHYPQKRAKQLKQNWVQNAKIRSKWKAEKHKLKSSEVPVQQEQSDEEYAESWNGIDEQLNLEPGKSNTVSEQPAAKEALRELRPEAYSRSSLHTFKSHPFQGGKKVGTTGKGQPNMKLRMNALLEKIKQDYT